MNIEQRLEQAIENDVDYADLGLTQLLKDALATIRLLDDQMTYEEWAKGLEI